MEKIPSRVRHHHAGGVMEPTVGPSVEADLPVWQEAPRGVNAPKKPAAEPEKVYINWAAAIWLIAVHIGALAAPWTFSWSLW